MRKLRIFAPIIAAITALGVLGPAMVSAADTSGSLGVTVFYGYVSIDGHAAPAGTAVKASVMGSQVASATTGSNGLQANQYRMDIQGGPALADKPVTFSVHGTMGAAGWASFEANRAFQVNLVASTTVTAMVNDAAQEAAEATAAAQGVSVFYGWTNAGAAVNATTSSGAVASATADSSGFWRMDVQSSSLLAGKVMTFTSGGVTSSALFEANRAVHVALGGVSAGSAASAGTTATGGAVFTGHVTIDGHAVSAGTTVMVYQVSPLRRIDTVKTDANGVFWSEIDSMEGDEVLFKVGEGSVTPVAWATFMPGHVITVDIAIAGGSVTSTVSVADIGVPAIDPAAVAAAQGVAVFHGYVNIGGHAAPMGTQVRLMHNGAIIATATTGADGLAANQFRFDIQSSTALAGSTVSFIAGAGESSALFEANRAKQADIHG